MNADVWAHGEHKEHFEALPKNRQSLVKGYTKRYVKSELVRRKCRNIGRKLTDKEERIGAMFALEVLLERTLENAKRRNEAG